MFGQTYTIRDLRMQFPNDAVCLEYLFKLRFKNDSCPTCISGKLYRLTDRKCYSCSLCKQQVYPLAGTIFHKTHVPLTLWFYALFLFSAAKNGVASTELARQIGVTIKTAWRMCTLIRTLMKPEQSVLNGVCEVDETWIGGKRRNNAWRDENKTAVMGLVERNGRVKVHRVPNNMAHTLLPHIKRDIAKGSHLLTDELMAYRKLSKLGYTHGSVRHSAKVWVKDGIYTNTIEGFWSQIKRSFHGTHHYVSKKYLQLYLNEQVWKYNHRFDEKPWFHQLLLMVELPSVGGRKRPSYLISASY